MAATVTAAIPPVPLDPVQEYFKIEGMSSAGTTWFMKAYQIVTIEDMLLFCTSEAQDLIKIYNGQQTHRTKTLSMAV